MAQKVTGYVTDALTGVGLGGALVVFTGGSGAAPYSEFVTWPNGWYNMEFTNSGVMAVVIKKVGYVDLITSYNMGGPSDIISISWTMTEAPELPPEPEVPGPELVKLLNLYDPVWGQDGQGARAFLDLNGDNFIGIADFDAAALKTEAEAKVIYDNYIAALEPPPEPEPEPPPTPPVTPIPPELEPLFEGIVQPIQNFLAMLQYGMSLFFKTTIVNPANSVSKVYLGVDAYTGEPATPNAEDYENAVIVTVMDVIALGAGVVSAGSVIFAGSGIAGVAPSLIESPSLVSATNKAAKLSTAITGLVAGASATTSSVFTRAVAIPGFGAFWKIMMVGIFIQQLDVSGWGFGLLPVQIHRRAEQLTKSLRGDLIMLDGLIRAEQWEAAGKLVQAMRVVIAKGRENLEGAPAEFWEYYGYTLDDVRAMFDTLEISIDALVVEYPAIAAPIKVYPEEITGVVTEVVDGDTFWLDDEIEVRMLGIDTHEIGSESGIIEYKYLLSKINGQTVTIKSWVEDQIGKYARLLAVPFLDGENISHYMLKRFGENILPPSKFHDRNKYVDWDENKLIAESAASLVPLPAVTVYGIGYGTLKVGSSPSNARIFMDDVDTNLNTSEKFDHVSVGWREVRVELDGYLPRVKEIDITSGKDHELFFRLVKGVAPFAEKKFTKGDIENMFKVGTMTEAEARSNLNVLGYTPEDIDGFIETWKIEMVGKPPLPPTGEFGTIFITSTPFYAKIFIDDVDTELITSQTILVPAVVEHTLKVVYPKYQDWTQTFTVAPGQKKEFYAIMTYSG